MRRSAPLSRHRAAQRRTRWWLLAAAVAVVVAAAPTVAVVVQADESFDPARGVSVPDVLANAQRYLGDELSVVGEADVVTHDAMTMGEEDLIVITADPSAQSFDLAGFSAGDQVRATGTLHLLDARGVVARLPERSLLPPQFQGFERQPVLFADDVSETEETVR